jgi:cell volume regulation protein A
VVASTLPFRIPAREQAFLSWAGLRGAVPIVLATIPLMYGRETAQDLLDLMVVVVVVYTLLQGTSLKRIAGWLGIIDVAPSDEVQIEASTLDRMGAFVLQVGVPEGSRMHGVYLSQLRLPKSTTVALILREGVSLPVTPTTRLQTGDDLLIVAPQNVRGATEQRLRAVSRNGPLVGWFTRPATGPAERTSEQ